MTIAIYPLFSGNRQNSAHRPNKQQNRNTSNASSLHKLPAADKLNLRDKAIQELQKQKNNFSEAEISGKMQELFYRNKAKQERPQQSMAAGSSRQTDSVSITKTTVDARVQELKNRQSNENLDRTALRQKALNQLRKGDAPTKPLTEAEIDKI